MSRRHAQRGVALIATMALILMGGSAYLVSRLKASSASYTVANKAHNTRVLRQAKEALIGWVANQAAKTGETNPGRLVCPEGSAYTGTDGVEGYSAPGLQSVGGTTYSAPTCASIGRFPWRSVGMVQLLDAASEPLWYVVGSTWRMNTSGTYTNINSNTWGDITYGPSYSATRTNGSATLTNLTTTQTAALYAGMKVGGTGIPAGTTVASTPAAGSTTVTLSASATASGTSALTFGEDAVALIIAPGAALDAQSASGCTARTQSRSTPSSSINIADYLECYDATTLQFTTNGGSTASNDQVMLITVADLMPAIEAAVAARIESEIVPVLKAVYASDTWGRSAATPLFPYPSMFTVTYSVTMGNGSNTLTNLTAAQTSSLRSGMAVSGTGIPAGTTVTSVGGTTVTLSQSATASLVGTAVTFAFNPGTLAHTYTVNMTSGNTVLSSLTATEIETLRLGMDVAGTGIAAGTKITSIGSTTVTLSQAATSSLTNSAVTFGTPGTATFQGTTATSATGSYQGLLPFTYTATSCGSDNRCSTSGTSAFTRNNSAIAPTVTKVSPAAPATITSSCSYNASLRARCTGNFDNNNSGTGIVLRMTVNVLNAAMALRTVDSSKIVAEWRTGAGAAYTTVTSTATASFNADGSATLVAEATLPYTGTSTWNYRFTITNTPLADHSILSSSDPTTGWFVRNEWYRLVHYGVAPTLTAAGLGTACTTGSNCLTLARAITNATNTSPIIVSMARGFATCLRPTSTPPDCVPSNPTTEEMRKYSFATGDQVTISGVSGNTAANGTWTVTYIDPDRFSLNSSSGNGAYAYGGTAAQANKRALLILAGRSLSNATRPSTTFADYLEFANAAGTATFEQQVVTMVPKMIATDTASTVNEFNVSAFPRANGTPLFIRAANTNTGAANLYAGGGQAREIFNLDGTSLAASQIRANSVVQVGFDGTYYYLSKKPFNDRVVVLDSN